MRKLLVVVAASITLFATGVAVAAIPSADGLITACVRAGGQLRVIDAEAGETCSANETQVEWSTGGEDHVHRPPVTQHQADTGPIPPGEQRTAIALCPTGKVSVGGFYVDRGPPSIDSHVGVAGDFIPISTAAGPDGYQVSVSVPADGITHERGYSAFVNCVPNPDLESLGGGPPARPGGVRLGER